MAQRKLNKQQKQRIRAQQDRTRNNAHATSATDDVNSVQFEGLIIQHHGKQAIVEEHNGRLINCKIRQNLGGIVCADQVIYQRNPEEPEGVILAVKERKSVLARPDFHRKPKPFAANIDQIIIVAAPEPELSEHLLDRYLVTLEALGLEGVIVINKTDLLKNAALTDIESRMSVYRQIGYKVLFCSVKTAQGLEELRALLKERTSILVGQSGVGKSSLINQILPDLDLRIGELSQANHGKHTTSSSTLYHLPFGGDIIDSPGVRDFAIWNISEEQIASGFAEFRQFQGHCRFHNCRHINEPDCAIKQAVKEGKISAHRLQSYQDMLAEIRQGKQDNLP
jgi:ribosome biogenesis GTPase